MGGLAHSHEVDRPRRPDKHVADDRVLQIVVPRRLPIPLDPALALGHAHQRGPARHVVAIEHPPELALDSLQPERQALGDLGVGVALGYELQDLSLARRRRA